MLLCLKSATSSVTSSEPLWCEDYTKLQIPVLLFGGWHDGYTNAAFRLAERLPNCRTVLGPWAHNWPDTAVPGPNIAYLDECLQFWTEHLKQEEVRLSWASLPSLRSRMEHSHWSRYSAHICGTFICWRQGLCHNNTSIDKSGFHAQKESIIGALICH